MPNDDPRPMTEDDTPEPTKNGGIVGWFLAADDEISIGPRVPARVRVLWGVLVLGALIWIIVQQHQILGLVAEARTATINRQVTPTGVPK